MNKSFLTLIQLKSILKIVFFLLKLPAGFL